MIYIYFRTPRVEETMPCINPCFEGSRKTRRSRWKGSCISVYLLSIPRRGGVANRTCVEEMCWRPGFIYYKPFGYTILNFSVSQVSTCFKEVIFYVYGFEVYQYWFFTIQRQNDGDDWIFLKMTQTFGDYHKLLQFRIIYSKFCLYLLKPVWLFT